MSRKRIVIDLDAAAPDGSSGARAQVNRAKKRRRWARVLGILFVLMLVVVGVLAIAGFLVWRHYQSTPSYALALMIDAAQRGDLVEFQKRLDEDEIAKNMVTAVSEKSAARYGLALSDNVKLRIDSTMPAVLQEIKPTIREEVTKEIQAFAAKSKPQPFILLVIGVPSLMKITIEGDTAKASATIDDRQVELAMSKGSDGWKVTGVKDDIVVQRIVDRVMTQLPAIGPLDEQFGLVKSKKRSKRRR